MAKGKNESFKDYMKRIEIEKKKARDTGEPSIKDRLFKGIARKLKRSIDKGKK
jgi:hypothetical protein